PQGRLRDRSAVLRRVLLALLAPVALSAQQPKPLSLEDAILMAQRQGPLAEMARTTRDAARARDHAFNARLLPQLSLGGNAANLNRGINPITLPDGSTQFVAQAQNQSSLGLAVSQKIPLTGGTLSIGSQLSRIDLFGDQTGKYWQTTPVVVGIQQDLFKPRELVWDEKVESLGALVAERQYLEAKEDVAGATAAAFFDLYASQMSYDNALANTGVNDTLYTLNKGRYEVGKIGENDLLKSELALLRARASLDDAKLSRDRAEAALRRMIDYPAGQALAIVTPDSIPTIDADPDTAVRMAIKNSSAMEQNDLDDVSTRRRTTEARLNNRFNATVSASVGFNQTAPIFGQAYQSPLGKQQLQVGVNMPMMQWGAGRADMEAAKADEMHTAANNKSRRDALAEDARFSVLQLQQAQRNVVLAAKADTVAAKQFEVAKNRYIIGKIAILDLYNAQTEKDDAVISRVQSLRNYWTSYYHLRRVTLYDFARKQEMSELRDR
ncbi:MAG: TolC family protein, partial [Gemmatimonadaceae bacterium]